MNEEQVERVVAAIIRDVRARKGIGDEWDMIDGEIQTEITERWREIVRSAAG